VEKRNPIESTENPRKIKKNKELQETPGDTKLCSID